MSEPGIRGGGERARRRERLRLLCEADRVRVRLAWRRPPVGAARGFGPLDVVLAALLAGGRFLASAGGRGEDRPTDRWTAVAVVARRKI